MSFGVGHFRCKRPESIAHMHQVHTPLRHHTLSYEFTKYECVPYYALLALLLWLQNVMPKIYIICSVHLSFSSSSAHLPSVLAFRAWLLLCYIYIYGQQTVLPLLNTSPSFAFPILITATPLLPFQSNTYAINTSSVFHQIPIRPPRSPAASGPTSPRTIILLDRLFHNIFSIILSPHL